MKSDDAAQPGDLMLRPAVLVAIVVLLMNDHVLKDQHPGTLTGKLSDLAGLFFFPVLLVSAAEVIASLGRRGPRFVGPRTLVACLSGVALVFTLSKVGGWFEGSYEVIAGWLRWPVGAAQDLLAGRSIDTPTRTDVTPDPSDLWTLVAVAAAGWLIARRRAPLWRRSAEGRSGELDGGLAAGEQVADEVEPKA
jgi:hypothetical protein